MYGELQLRCSQRVRRTEEHRKKSLGGGTCAYAALTPCGARPVDSYRHTWRLICWPVAMSSREKRTLYHGIAPPHHALEVVRQKMPASAQAITPPAGQPPALSPVQCRPG